MSVPAFSFTSRAMPIAEIGRPGPFDAVDVHWVDIGCDVYEITTDTGRGSISDRFAPGTATIVASNASGWADGTVPLQWSYFADEFNRTGPMLGSNWQPWTPLETWAGADALVIDAGAAVVQAHPAASVALTALAAPLVLRGSWSGAGGAAATATIGPFPGMQTGDVVLMALAVDMIMDDTSSKPTIPGWSDVSRNPPDAAYYHRLWTHRVTAEEAAGAATWTWTAALPETQPWHWTACTFGGVGASVQTNIFSTNPISAGATVGFYSWVAGAIIGPPGITPVPGCVVARFAGSAQPHTLGTATGATVGIHQHDAATVDWTWSELLGFDETGGVLVEYPENTGTPAAQFDWTSPPAPPWPAQEASMITVIVIPGPAPDPDSIPHQGRSTAIWALGYDGDQFVDTVLSGLAAPDKLWPSAYFRVELALRATAGGLAAVVAVLEWTPDWDDPAVTLGTVSWSINRRVADGTWQGAAFVSGVIDVGPDGFPAPVRVRFEADDGGGVRLWFDGDLVGDAVDPAPPSGDQIGLYADYEVGALSYGSTVQPGPPRFERVVGGSNIDTPIYLEPGVRVRIGVNHQIHGLVWLFHGYVDGFVPTYDPQQRPVARIECIDALGEIGRLPLADIGGFQPEEAWQRVTRLLDEADWPDELADIRDDATWMDNSDVEPDRAVELLTQTAESCGGAVYGDPHTGRLTFRGRDWQAWDPDLPPDGYITNGSAPPGTLTACPSTWERSWKREDMTTRAALTSAQRETRSYSNPDAEARFGVEPYVRTLVCTEGRILNILGHRQLKLRGPGAFPRVAAVLLDAATGDAAVDVMTVSTFTRPDRYQCGLHRDGLTVFDRQYLVTGARHTITRDRWQCRLALDIADVFATKGARWGRGHWGVGVWGHSI